MIDLVTLKDFLVLCQVRSFSRAAERCHVSVSGLSRRIQGLEQWLGAPVFDRRKAALELTEPGQRLLAVSSEVVYALEGLRKSIKADGEDRQSRIRFAAPHIMSAVFFPDWVPRLHNDFKSARFSVDSDNLPECVEMLRDGSADYAVALFDEAGAVAARLGTAFDAGDFRMLELGHERLVPVSAPNAAGRPRFDLHDCTGEPISFLGYADECHLGWSLQPLLQRYGELRLRQDHGASLADGLRFMALSGLGVAWLPHALVREDMHAGRLVRAGEAAFDVALRFTLLRRPDALATQAERLWRYLSDLAQASPPIPAGLAAKEMPSQVPAPATLHAPALAG
ncbi:LysR family transcriptional regulator [Variovorax sp. RCC_210]|uniref:LysR family transcriptional regulator n=1 Tax=Variovorax sp. RCC_210 TaxID=3239217 RepID=UPI003525B42F